MKRRVSLLVLLALPAACGHWDLGDRAPGHIDVTRPPENLASRMVDTGADPGETWFVIRPGPFLSGMVVADRDDARLAGNVGFELMFTGGRRSRTHDHPIHLEFDHFSQTSDSNLALNLGISVASRDASGPARPAFYAELQTSRFGAGGAAGWNWRLDGHHGPQLTGFFGPLYLRAGHHLRHQTTVELGLVIKGELTWAWSR